MMTGLSCGNKMHRQWYLKMGSLVGIDLQDGKLPRRHHKHREQRETDDEAGQSCQVAGTKS